MGAERFGRLKELFVEACELAPGERREHLERLTADPALIEEALELARGNDVHTSRATHGARPTLDAAGDEMKPGDLLGH